MKELTATGTTVQEAVESALAQLQTTEDRIDIRVIDEGKKGFLGLFGSRPAVVHVKVKIDPVEEAKTFLQNVFRHMNVSVDIEGHQDGKVVYLQLHSDDVAMVIGKRGQTLNALQYLTQLAVNRQSEQYVTVVLDAENYRERRKETLIQLAERLAQKAIRTKQKVSLEPMPSYERKVIHTALMNNKYVETESEGVEPFRHIVIIPKNE
ncbi:RNA-binding cell elongation regulator Jag/EloR [Aeribacillus pallidus]|uniref:RNA-binding cell elongation regulator Jag/EloR n=1 Tax=Aeribacillus pallidus TaxID=33936 RepID=UPI003D20D869